MRKTQNNVLKTERVKHAEKDAKKKRSRAARLPAALLFLFACSFLSIAPSDAHEKGGVAVVSVPVPFTVVFSGEGEILGIPENKKLFRVSNPEVFEAGEETAVFVASVELEGTMVLFEPRSVSASSPNGFSFGAPLHENADEIIVFAVAKAYGAGTPVRRCFAISVPKEFENVPARLLISFF